MRTMYKNISHGSPNKYLNFFLFQVIKIQIRVTLCEEKVIKKHYKWANNNGFTSFVFLSRLS